MPLGQDGNRTTVTAWDEATVFDPNELEQLRIAQQLEIIQNATVTQQQGNWVIRGLQARPWPYHRQTPAKPQQPRYPEVPLPPDTDGKATANTFLVGCDPEMIIQNGAELVNVRDTIPAAGQVGYDHNGDVIEVRPAPARSTYTLVKRIQAILAKHKALDKYRNYRIRGGAFRTFDHTEWGNDRAYISLGGHVHLDIKNDTDDGYNLVTDALDRVTRYLEKLDILPQAESKVRRKNSEYGFYGDIRTDNNRLEYRTMASWMFDPKTAFLCMTAAKLAAHSPETVLDTLKVKNIGYNHLKALFDEYATADVDARRTKEALLAGPLTALQADPDTNVNEAWKTVGF